MKKKILISVFIIFNIVFLSSAEKKQPLIIQYDLDPKYKMDREILEKYGNLWGIYTLSEEICINRSNRVPVEEISFFYRNNNNFIFLGKYNKLGIYNNANELIFDNPYSENFVGYIENVLVDPFYTGVYAYENENSLGGFEPYTKIEIDFQNNSIKLTEFTYTLSIMENGF